MTGMGRLCNSSFSPNCFSTASKKGDGAVGLRCRGQSGASVSTPASGAIQDARAVRGEVQGKVIGAVEPGGIQHLAANVSIRTQGKLFRKLRP